MSTVWKTGRLFLQALGEGADEEGDEDGAGDGGAEPAHQREHGHDDAGDEDAEKNGDHGVGEAEAHQERGHGAGPGAGDGQGNGDEDGEAEGFVFFHAGGLVAGAGEEPLEEALADGDLHAEVRDGAEEQEDERDGDHVAEHGPEKDAGGSFEVIGTKAAGGGVAGQEQVADGDGPAEFDDGEGGDGGDGEVVGEAEVVVEKAGDGFADPLAGALVGEFDRAFGGGALDDGDAVVEGWWLVVGGWGLG